MGDDTLLAMIFQFCYCKEDARKILTTDLHLKHLYDEHFTMYQHGPGVEVILPPGPGSAFRCMHCKGTGREPCSCPLGEKCAKSGNRLPPVYIQTRQPVCERCQNTSRLPTPCTQCYTRESGSGSGNGWYRHQEPDEWPETRTRFPAVHKTRQSVGSLASPHGLWEGPITKDHFGDRPWYSRDIDDQFLTFIYWSHGYWRCSFCSWSSWHDVYVVRSEAQTPPAEGWRLSRLRRGQTAAFR